MAKCPWQTDLRHGDNEQQLNLVHEFRVTGRDSAYPVESNCCACWPNGGYRVVHHIYTHTVSAGSAGEAIDVTRVLSMFSTTRALAIYRV